MKSQIALMQKIVIIAIFVYVCMLWISSTTLLHSLKMLYRAEDWIRLDPSFMVEMRLIDQKIRQKNIYCHIELDELKIPTRIMSVRNIELNLKSNRNFTIKPVFCSKQLEN